MNRVNSSSPKIEFITLEPEVMGFLTGEGNSITLTWPQGTEQECVLGRSWPVLVTTPGGGWPSSWGAADPREPQMLSLVPD